MTKNKECKATTNTHRKNGPQESYTYTCKLICHYKITSKYNVWVKVAEGNFILC